MHRSVGEEIPWPHFPYSFMWEPLKRHYSEIWSSSECWGRGRGPEKAKGYLNDFVTLSHPEDCSLLSQQVTLFCLRDIHPSETSEDSQELRHNQLLAAFILPSFAIPERMKYQRRRSQEWLFCLWSFHKQNQFTSLNKILKLHKVSHFTETGNAQIRVTHTSLKKEHI